jgi:hypothetical protein
MMAALDRRIADRRTRLAQICLGLPEVTSNGDQHLRSQVRGRTFAYFLEDHHGDGRVALNCKVPIGDLDALVKAEPERLFLPAYLASRGWIGVRLDLPSLDWLVGLPFTSAPVALFLAVGQGPAFAAAAAAGTLAGTISQAAFCLACAWIPASHRAGGAGRRHGGLLAALPAPPGKPPPGRVLKGAAGPAGTAAAGDTGQARYTLAAAT